MPAFHFLYEATSDVRIKAYGPGFEREYRDLDLMTDTSFGNGISISRNNFIIDAPLKNGTRGSVQFGNME